MRKISCGVSGTNEIPVTHHLSDIPASPELLSALKTHYRKDLLLRPAQDYAVFHEGLLAEHQNLIIATPTNSGKSLLSYLLLFQNAVEGKNAILVEPLRALAYEKSEELKSIVNILQRQSRIKVKVVVSTGDYRLTNEFMNTQPEKLSNGQGQIIVATPERLDAISRMKENTEWFETVSTICFDEAHLIGDSNRGPTLELLIAYLRSLESNPQIVLMSATIANPNYLAAWLNPCKVINVADRYPQLEKWVYCVEDCEDANDILLNEVTSTLIQENTSIIIFVYQTASAEKLATQLAKQLSGRRIAAHDLSATMNAGVAWFHANMSAATKASVIEAMNCGNVRVTVSTTALSMGINLPATHVYVRDVTFTGFKDLNVSDLMQMLGRAGRGNRSGVGVVMLNKSNLPKETTVVDGLTNESLPVIQSALIPQAREDYYGSSGTNMFYIDRIGNQIIGALNRFQSVTKGNLESYLQKTLCGASFSNIDDILRYLIEWKLAYQDENTNEYALTALGQVSSRCYFPPMTAANISQFIRDLLLDDPSGKHLAEFAPIDYLIMLCLTSNEFKTIARYSKKVETSITQYMEALPLEEKSYLYRTWLAAEPESLWGSARTDYSSVDAKKQVYVRTYTAMLIYDLSKGIPVAQLKSFYKIDVEELQEKLRDNAIWLLSGIERLTNVRCFYYHLKENCKATPEQIHSVDVAFRKSSKNVFTLIGNLKYRSKLGEMIRGIKRVYPHAENYPGEGTIKKLEAAGIVALKDLVRKSADDLVALGVQRKYADLIVSYVKKRLS